MQLVRDLSPSRVWRVIRREFKVLRHALRSRVFARVLRRRSEAVRQEPPNLVLDVGDVSCYSGLMDFLTQNGIRFSEGWHTIYVPPQERFIRTTGLDMNLYPPDAGFKLLKRFAPLERANYLIDGSRQPVKRIMLGSLENQVDAANLLYSLGLGPRLYDLAEIQSSRFKTGCFVVQHIDGEPPTYDEWHAFMARMRAAIDGLKGAVALVPQDGWNHSDFRPLDCGGNLLKRSSDGELFYIDFQQFVVVDERAIIARILDDSKQAFHFGDCRRLLRSKRYLYQSIPGVTEIAKRDVQRRWTLFHSLLQSTGIDLQGRSVLDIGCNAGMFMALALANGARMGMGWDLPEVIASAEQLQLALGNTRMLFFRAHLGSDYSLSKDVPDWAAGNFEGSIVFYLAAWRHVGFIADLANIPWRALIFEGHQGDTEEETLKNFHRIQSLWGCRLVRQDVISDGHSDTRPVALFLRDSRC